MSEVVDLITKSVDELVNSPNVVPSSFKKTSPPSASRTISVVAFNVIVEPDVISAITGVVNVLFVRVAVEAVETKRASPPLLGSVKVLEPDSACGEPIRVCA